MDAKFQSLCANEYESQRENTDGDLPSGHENPERPFAFLFAPRGNDQRAQLVGCVAATEISSLWNFA